MKLIAIILCSTLSLSLLPGVGIAQDKTKSREMVLKAIKDPSEATRLRTRFKNASSKKELEDIAEMKKSIESAVSSANSSLPKQIDKDMKIVSITTSGDNIIYKLSLLNDGQAFQNKDEVMSKTKERATKEFCTYYQALWVILGYTVHYTYYQKNGKYYGGFVIDAKTCGFE
jgi:hypothetical protein